MNLFTASLYVAFGGGLGAICRYLLAETIEVIFSSPGYLSIMLVNIVGCFFIGLVFLLLEARLRRDGKTRLPQARFEKTLSQTPGLFHEDLTLQAVDHFRSNQKLHFLSGFLITGFLGGFTTFSSFCLFTVTLYQSNHFLAMAMNLLLSPALSILAVILGIWVAQKIVMQRL